jgi:hypothetical protein
MRTTGRIVMLFGAGLLVITLWTPATAQDTSCEFTALGLSCYYTINAYCDANYGCWSLIRTFYQGTYIDEWPVYIWPAGVGYTLCYHLNQTGVWILKNSYVACNPQILY